MIDILVFQKEIPFYRKNFFIKLGQKSRLTICCPSPISLPGVTVVNKVEDITKYSRIVIPGSLRLETILFFIRHINIRDKLSVWLIGHMPGERIFKKILRYPILKLARTILFYSEFEKGLYQILFPSMANKMRAFQNGIYTKDDLSSEVRKRSGSGRISFAYVGRVHRKSAIYEFCKIVSEAKLDLELVVYGEIFDTRLIPQAFPFLKVREPVTDLTQLRYETSDINYFLYPGAIGLSAATALALGMIPIVGRNRRAQAPEYNLLDSAYKIEFNELTKSSIQKICNETKEYDKCIAELAQHNLRLAELQAVELTVERFLEAL